MLETKQGHLYRTAKTHPSKKDLPVPDQATLLTEIGK